MAPKALTVRDVPEPMYRALAALARRNRRSLQQQVLTLLERAQALPEEPPSETARSMRERLAGRKLGDTVAEVRRERSR
ncbi:MAG: hypothetical protein EXR72_06040 [Myxococcales bacterium]|nr:hypothetical protein [Myxococcales bacterium]